MRKKILKSLYCLAMMLLTVGAFCFVSGMQKTHKVENSVAGEDSISMSAKEGATPTELWTDHFDAEKNPDIQEAVSSLDDPETINGAAFYPIQNAEQLAFVSYNIVHDQDIATGVKASAANYVLKADIDLSEKLWTGIGTEANPYTGEFFGDGYKVSGIVMADVSSSVGNGNVYAGLFGKVNNGGITSVIIDSFKYVSTSVKYKGALVAYGSSIRVVNCYDYRPSSEKDVVNGTPAIGVVAEAMNYVVTGGNDMRAGGTGDVKKYTTKEAIDANRLTIGESTSASGSKADLTQGYAVGFDTGSAYAELYKTLAGQTDVKLNHLFFYTSDLTDSPTLGRISSSIFGSVTGVPVLRNIAINNNVDPRAYVIRKGYKLQDWGAMSDWLTNGLRATANFEKTNIDVTIDYGYGVEANKRVTTYAVPYDATFKEALTDGTMVDGLKVNAINPLRIGYVLEGVYGNSAFTGDKLDQSTTIYIGDAVAGYTDDAPAHTIYTNWTIGAKHSFQISRTRMAGEDFASSEPFGDITVSGADAYSDGDVMETNTNAYINHTPNADVTISFTLASGYTLDTFAIRTADTTGATTYGAAEYYENANLTDANEQGYAPNSRGGVNAIIAYTGKGLEYTSPTTQNLNDPYTPVNAEIVKAENGTYTITIKNMVAGANFYLVACREEVAIELKNVAGELSLAGHKPAFTAVGSKTTDATGNENSVLYTRTGESFVLTLDASATDKYFMMNPSSNAISGIAYVGKDAGAEDGQLGLMEYWYANHVVATATELGFTHENAGAGAGKYINFSASTLTIKVQVNAPEYSVKPAGATSTNDLIMYVFNGTNKSGTTESNNLSASVGMQTIPGQDNQVFGFRLGYDNTNPFYELNDRNGAGVITLVAANDEVLSFYFDTDAGQIIVWNSGYVPSEESPKTPLELGGQYGVTFYIKPIEYTINVEYTIDGKTIEEYAAESGKNATEIYALYFQSQTMKITSTEANPTYALTSHAISATLTDAYKAYFNDTVAVETYYMVMENGQQVKKALDTTYLTNQTFENGVFTVTAQIAATEFGPATTEQYVRVNFTTKDITLKFTEDASTPMSGFDGTNTLEHALMPITEGGAVITSLKAKLDIASGKLTLENDVQGVNIISGYYFLNWYLQGDTVISQIDGNKYAVGNIFASESDSLSAVEALIDKGTTTINVFAKIQAKTVAVTFDGTGDALVRRKLADNSYSSAEENLTEVVTFNYPDTERVFSFTQRDFWKIAYTWTGWETTNTNVARKTNGSTFTAAELVAIWGELAQEPIYNIDGHAVTLYADSDMNGEITFTPTWTERAMTATWTGLDSENNKVDGSITVKVGDTIWLKASSVRNEATFATVRGDLTSVTNKASVLIPVGYHANGFTLVSGTKQNSRPQTEGDVAITDGNDVWIPLTITAENIESLLSSDYYFASAETGSSEFVLSITEEDGQIVPNVYNVTIDLHNVDGKYYETLKALNEEHKLVTHNPSYTFTINYKADVGARLNELQVSLTRLGYTLKALVGSVNSQSVTFAEFDGTTWKTNNNFFNLADNIQLHAVYEVNATDSDKHIGVELINEQSLIYNGDAQTVAKAVISTKNNEDVAVANFVFASGERIVSYAWNEAGDGLNLNLTNYAQSYRMVDDVETYIPHTFTVTIKDLFTNENYTITIDTTKAAITKNTVTATRPAISSYYSGTETFYGVPNEDGVVTLGQINYVGGTKAGSAVAGLGNITINRLVDSANSGFIVGNTYAAVYRFELSDEIADNFTNITSVVDNGVTYYEYLVTGAVAIVKTPITVTAYGNGLYVADSIKQYPNYNTADASVYSIFGNEDYAFEIQGTLETSSGAFGKYLPTGDKTFGWAGDYTITKGGNDVTAYFDVTFAGEYDIVDANESNANIFQFNARDVYALDNVLNAKANDTASITLGSLSISANGTELTDIEWATAGNGIYTYRHHGNAILTISGYGTYNLKVIVLKSQVVDEVTYNYTVALTAKASAGADGYKFAGFFSAFEPETISSEVSLAVNNGLTDEANLTSDTANPYAGTSNISLVYTNVKPIKLSTVTGSTSTILVSKGTSLADRANPVRTGFDFAGWTNLPTGVTAVVSGDNTTFTVADSADLAAATINATWTVAKPVVSGIKTTITKFANEAGSIPVNVSELYTAIDNRSSENMSYTYAWFTSEGVELTTNNSSTGDRHTFNNLSAGQYYVVITATYTGSDSYVTGNTNTSSNIEFTLVVNKLTITASRPENAQTSYEFAGSDLKSKVNDISISIFENVGETAIETISNAFNNSLTDKKFNFSISYKKDESANAVPTTSIYNAGIYTITLNVTDTDVYNIPTNASFEIVVTKKALTLAQTDVDVLSKTFGEEDKDPLSITKTIFAGVTNENIEFTFTREEGEAVDSYPLTLTSAEYENAHTVGGVTITPEDNYTITATGLNFVIGKTTSKLYIELNEELSLVYAGQANSVSIGKPVYADDEWTITLTLGENSQTVKVVNMYYLVGAVYTKVTKDIENALADFTFQIFDEDGANTARATNVGSYTVKAIGANATYTGLAFCTTADSKVTASDNASLKVTAKDIVVTEITKDFDTTDTFNLANITSTGIVAGDAVTISGTFDSEEAGDRTIKTIEKTGANAANYNIVTTSASVSISKSDNAVSVTVGKDSFVYGDLGSSITEALAELTVSVAGHETGANYISVGALTIADANANLSTAEKLKVGTYTVSVTLTSTCYTDVNGKTFTLTITKKNIDISKTEISKEYDGTTSLPSDITWNMNGALATDDVSIDASKASFASAEWTGLDKATAITGMVLAGDDKDNYELIGDVSGNIVDTELTFNSDYSFNFVDDDETDPTNDTFKVIYRGSVDGLLTQINNVSTTRTGYTQKGWKYNNVVLTEDNIASLLADAVKAKREASDNLTLNANWTINTIELVINPTNATVEVTGDSVVKANDTTWKFNYFSTVTVKVTGAEGYKLQSVTGFTVPEANITGRNTKNATIILEKLRVSGTLGITMAEINVTVVVDKNKPAHADIDSAWGVKVQENFTYTQAKEALNSILPALTPNPLNSYVQGDFAVAGDNANVASIAYNSTASLWSLLDDVTADTTITFTASWTEADVALTITTDGNADVVVKVGENTITGNANVYTVKFYDTVTISVTGKTGYKFKEYTASEDFVNGGISTPVAGNKTAEFTITNVQSAGSIAIKMDTIKVTITVDKNTPNYVTDADISLPAINSPYVYNTIRTSQVSSVIIDSTIIAGTYTFAGYEYAVGDAEFAALGTKTIADIFADPTSDVTLKLQATWTAVEYTITFTTDEGTIVGETTIKVPYGGTLPTLPTFNNPGKTGAWKYVSGDSERIVKAGDVLTDFYYNAGAAITFVAEWNANPYKLNIVKDGTHFTNVLVNGTAITDAGVEVTVLDTIKVIAQFADGYRLLNAELDNSANATISGRNGNEFTITGVNANITITLTEEAITYKFIVDAVSGIETITGANEKEIKFDAKYSTSGLADVVIARTGYTLAKFVDANDESIVFVTFDDSGVATYTDAAYTTAGDTHVKAVWTLNAGYYTASATTTDRTYNGLKQDVATASISENGAVVSGTQFANKDTIKAEYWAIVNGEGEAKTYTPVTGNNGKVLSLKNVADSNAKYAYVVVIVDALTNKEYTIYTTDTTIKISQNNVEADGFTFKGYYTNTDAYVATEDAVSGKLVYATGKTNIDELAVKEIKFAAINNVGTGYGVKIYLSGASEEVVANYANIKHDDSGYYFEVAGSAEVVKTKLHVVVSGSGFETGTVHQPRQVVITSAITGNFDALEISAVVTTKDATLGVKTDFNVDFNSITLGGVDVKANFDPDNLIFDGSKYTIISKADAYTTNIDITKFGTGDVNAILTISSVVVGEDTITIPAIYNFYNHHDGDTVVFTISANRSGKVTIIVNKDYTVSFKVAVSGYGDNKVIGWFSKTDAEDESKLYEALRGLTGAQSYVHSFTAENADKSVVLTTLKAVKAYIGDGSDNGEWYYFDITDTTTGVKVEVPTWKGYDFKEWRTTLSNSQVKVEKRGDEYYVVALAGISNIQPTRITALWNLAKPVLSLTNSTVNASADPNGVKVASEQLAPTIANSDAGITYSYKWFNGENEITPDKDGLIIVDGKVGSNTYSIQVVAERDGYEAVSSEKIAFTVVVVATKLSMTAEAQTFDYANKNFASNVYATVDGKQVIVGEHLDSTANFYFTIEKDSEAVTEIKDAGNYTISFNVNGSYYETDSASFAVTVNQATRSISAADLSNKGIWEYVGHPKTNDDLKANFTFEFTSFGTSETIEVSFVRPATEDNAVGFYGQEKGFAIASGYSANYILTLESDAKYEIRQFSGELRIEVVDKDNLTKVYDGENVKLEIATNGKSIFAYNASDVAKTPIATSDIKLYTYDPDSEAITEIEDGAILNALSGISFAIAENNASVKADGYEITIEIGANASYGVVQFLNNAKVYFNVTQKTITVTSVKKFFDRTADVSSENNTETYTQISANGIITADEADVVISGTFNDEYAGTNKTVTLELTGAKAGNYKLVLADSAVVEIEKSNAPVEVEIGAIKSFPYATFKSDMTASDITDILGQVVAKIGETSDAISLGYITVTSIAWKQPETGSIYSNANHLKAGTQTLVVTLSSSNYVNADKAFEFEITITKKEIDLSGVQGIEKEYDGEVTLPDNINWGIDANIETGDKVSVNGTFDSADYNGGNPSAITAKLTGDDADNYLIIAHPQGIINQTTVTLVVDYTPQTPFVDGEKDITIERTRFDISYPFNGDAQTTLNSFKLPTRVGYTAKSWSVSLDDRTAITATNFGNVLDAAFQAKKDKKEYKIGVNWERNNVTITLSDYENAGFEITTDGLEFVDGALTVPYYSSVTVNVTANVGYKFVNAKLSDSTKANATISVANAGKRSGGSFTLSNVSANVTVELDIQVIKVTINIAEGNHEHAELTANPWNKVKEVYDYTAEDLNKSIAKLLPELKVTDGTYTLSGWTSSLGGEYNLTNTSTIKDIFTAPEDDEEITFTAKWTGITITVTFNENGGTWADGTNHDSIEVVFGEALSTGLGGRELPVAIKPGQVQTWNDAQSGLGNAYDKTTLLTTPASLIDGVYTLPLYAIFTNGSATVTVVIENKAGFTSIADGITELTTLTNNYTKDLKYSVDELILNVSVKAGYSFKAELSPNTGVLDVTNSSINLSLLASNATLTITAVPKESTLTVNVENAEITKKIVGSDGINNSDPIITAVTGQSVTLEFTPKAGYEFTEESTISLEGSGSIGTPTINAGVLTVVWSGFTDDATLNVIASAKQQTITIVDTNNLISEISFNEEKFFAASADKPINGTKVTYPTGQLLTVKVTLKYGYESTTLSVNGGTAVRPSAEVKHESTKLVQSNFTFTVLDSDFNIEFNASPRKFTIEAKSNISERGTVHFNGKPATSADSQQFDFGDEITVVATPSSTDYVFAGWYLNETPVSTIAQSTFTFNLTERFLNALEGEGNMTLIAMFENAERNTTISIGVNGGATISINGTIQDELTSTGVNKKIERTYAYDSILTITLNPVAGYEVDKVIYRNIMNDEITNNTWFDSETNTITITIGATSPASIEVTYKASVAVVNVNARISINNQFNYGSAMGGTIVLTDDNGNRVTDSITNEEVKDVTYKVNAITGGTIYFMATANAGYTMEVSSPTAGVAVNQIQISGGRTLYAVNNIIEGTQVYATFTAKINKINIQLVDADGRNVEGGHLIADVSPDIFVNGNGNNIIVSAITNEKTRFSISAQVGMAYSLIPSQYNASQPKVEIIGLNTDNVIIGDIEEMSMLETGYSGRSVITISNIYTDGTIKIYVQPKTYRVVFVNRGNDIVGPAVNVAYGNELVVPEYVQQAINNGRRESSVFLGFYTMGNAQGKQYIDNGFNSLSVWKETGYQWKDPTYVKNDGYDEATRTIRLYAGWKFETEDIIVDIAPEIIKQQNKEISIADIMTSFNPEAAWTSPDQLYIKVAAGEQITMQAPKFDGYTFVRWEIARISADGREENIVKVGETLIYDVTSGETTVKLVYNVDFELAIGLGGSGRVYILQDNTSLGAIGSFDSTKPVTIVAQANPGYTFLGWFDTATGELYSGINSDDIIFNQANKTYTYTFADLLDTPLYLTAMFEGDKVGAIFNLNGLAQHGTVVEVSVNNGEIITDLTKEFEVRVGQVVKATVRMNYGYGLVWDGKVKFENIEHYYESATRTTVYTFEYKVKAEDLDRGEGTAHEFILNIAPTASPNKVNYTFNVGVLNSTNSLSEVVNAGQISYTANGMTANIVNGTRLPADFNGMSDIYFGTALALDYRLFTNYTIDNTVGSVIITVGGTDHDVTNRAVSVEQQRIYLYSSFLEEFEAGENVIVTINFSRLRWIDFASSSFKGEGTETNPYLISSAEDLALLANYVNKGQVNSAGLKYADAVYEVTNDLDFNGKFWTPIGTRENPFNGTIHFRKYSISNIEHEPYTTYENPTTRFSGVFWICTEHAKILQTNSEIVLALSIVGGVVGLLLLILLIILILRRKRKKRMEELANG